MSGKWWEELPKVDPLDAALEAEGITGKLAELARSVYAQESSSGTNSKTSNAGAVGGMQILPKTFKSVADDGWSIDDPIQNARGGVRYLAQLFERAGGDPALTAAGYYGGPSALDKAKKGEAVSDPRNPKAPNTLEYAQQVVSRMGVDQPEKSTDWWSSMPLAEPVKTSHSTAQNPNGTLTDAKATPMPDGNGAVSPAPSFGGELLRQLGLTGRAVVSGVAALPAMASDALTGPINAGLDAIQGKDNGFRFKRAEAALNDAMTMAGLPEPRNAQERIVQDVTGAMTGTGATVAAGNLLAKGSGLAQGVGNALADSAGLQTVSTAGGAGAAGLARENGASAGTQAVAGVAGALVPALAPVAAGAAFRGAMRGGEVGRQAVADKLTDFQAAGVQPSISQVTGGRTAQATESMLAKVPGSAGVMAEFAQTQADDMARAVQNLSDELAPGASAANAGEAIARGVTAFKDGIKEVQKRLYAALDDHIQSDTLVPVSHTRATLSGLNASVDGAENVSKLFANSKLTDVERALIADAEHGALPFEAVKRLRTLIGEQIGDAGLVPDVPTRQLKALYGALSDDLGTAAKQAGPDAEHAWNWANQFTKQQMGRLEDLQRIVNKDAPEKVFHAVVSGSTEGDTIAKRVISALPMAERREVAAAVLQRLGRAGAGQQNAMGDAFSAEAFLTNLSKLSPAARETLLGRTDLDGVMDMVNHFAAVSGTRREGGRVFANPSGTAPAAAQMALGSGIAGGVASAAMGHPLPLVGALAVPAVANLTAKAVTNPELVNMLATTTQMAPGAGAALVNAAANLDTERPVMEPQWWDHAPMILPAPLHPADVAQTLQQVQSVPLPTPAPAVPVDTRGQIERIADAKSVDEAIRALHEPDEVQTGRKGIDAKRMKLHGEIERLKQMNEQARRLKLELERNRLEAMRAAYQ